MNWFRKILDRAKLYSLPKEAKLKSLPELLKGEKNIELKPVIHDIGNDDINQAILDQANSGNAVAVEGSLYLGGFIPEDAAKDKIYVMLEPPELFFSGERQMSLSDIYFRGREISESATYLRRMFEKIAYDIDADVENQDIVRMANELLFLRRNYPNEVIFNQPEEWLRTVWYDADLIFYYLCTRDKFGLFGCLIYSDMDTKFIDFIRNHSHSINAMTGSKFLLFSFDGTLDRESDMSLNTEYVMYKSIVDRSERLGPKSAQEYDAILSGEEKQLRELEKINRSIMFGEKLGVPIDKTPCIVFWKNLDSTDILVFPFVDYANDVVMMKNIFKEMVAIVKDELINNPEANLDIFENRFKELHSKYQPSRFDSEFPAGETIRLFLNQLNIDMKQENILGDKILNYGTGGGIVMGDKYEFGDVIGSNINIKSTLDEVNQTIASSPIINTESRKELFTLFDQLKTQLEKAPKEKLEQAEAVADSAKAFIDASSKPNPNKTTIQISADGLKAAAKNIAGVMPAVLSISAQIIKVVFNLLGLPTP